MIANDLPAGGSEPRRETIACPLCGAEHYSFWAEEGGFTAVRCWECGLIYVNPRPALSMVDRAVRTGAHSDEVGQLNVVGRRVPGKVRHYQKVIPEMFHDLFESREPISWLDVGAGFGEVVEAVSRVAPSGSRLEGIEPMGPKVRRANARGIAVREGYVADIEARYQVVSLINVFSHIPDFRAFLREVKNVLAPDGELLVETGNAADIGERKHFPGPLTLPDHLVFAGEEHIRRFLEEAGFRLIRIKRLRMDGLAYSLKNAVKRALGRPAMVGLPYTSPARTILYRARLVPRGV